MYKLEDIYSLHCLIGGRHFFLKVFPYYLQIERHINREVGKLNRILGEIILLPCTGFRSLLAFDIYHACPSMFGLHGCRYHGL